MLATLVDEPFDRPGWVYEEKYDGYRILAYKEGAAIQLLSRNGLDRTATFPEIAEAIGRLRDRTLLLDGEAVAFDRHRVSRFQLLQRGSARHVFVQVVDDTEGRTVASASTMESSLRAAEGDKTAKSREVGKLVRDIPAGLPVK